MADRRITYPIVISKENDGYYVEIPDFDMATQGEDIADAISMARDIIQIMAIDLEEEGKPLPIPGTAKIEVGENDIVTWVNIGVGEVLSGAKLNKRWRRERMILYLRDQDIRADALKEGRKLGHAEGHAEGCDLTRREIVRGMIDNGVNRELICRSASITEEDLEKILQEISEG